MECKILICIFAVVCSVLASGNHLESNAVTHKMASIRRQMDESSCGYGGRLADCEQLMSAWFAIVNDEALRFNVLASEVAWKTAVGKDDDETEGEAVAVGAARSKWREYVCEQASIFGDSILNESQERQLYLLCRGVSLTLKETKKLNTVLNEMQNIYTTSKICINVNENSKNQTNADKVKHYLLEIQFELEKQNQNIPMTILGSKFENNFNRSNMKRTSDLAVWKAALLYNNNGDSKDIVCFSGEPDLERLMASSRREDVLKWTWLVWRQAVGPPTKPLYAEMIDVENRAARRKGYVDVGEVWREELEIENLKQLTDELLDDVKELYQLLHAVANFFIKKKYKIGDKNVKSYVEAHLTGNMWGQNWESLLDVILPLPKNMDLNYMIQKKNWTSHDMVKRAEDFYVSLGFPWMTEKFWQYSYFGIDGRKSSEGDEVKCHGTAANMFRKKDYRMIYCANLSVEDFYVIHHELGHIQYYMAYKDNLPTLFLDGTNSAFQESIGDAVMLAVMAPQHLLRLGLINDKSVYIYPNQIKNSDKIQFDDVLLLRQGLSKIPQVPFAYIIDKYRWETFSGQIKPYEYNAQFWKYTMKYQGLAPPNGLPRGEEYFDVAAKYHIPDNTPYVRYFLSSFLQMQIFKGMCQLSLFGSVDSQRKLPMPLHRCDVYGSKKIGPKLREVMSKGSSVLWSEALFNLTGENTISSTAFLEYFEPLKMYLIQIIEKYNIPVGW